MPGRASRACGDLGAGRALHAFDRLANSDRRRAGSRRRPVHHAVRLPDGVPLSAAPGKGALAKTGNLAEILDAPLFQDRAAVLCHAFPGAGAWPLSLRLQDHHRRFPLQIAPGAGTLPRRQPAVVLPTVTLLSWITYTLIEVPGQKAGRFVVQRFGRKTAPVLEGIKRSA